MLFHHRATRLLAPVLMAGAALAMTAGPASAAPAARPASQPAAVSHWSGGSLTLAGRPTVTSGTSRAPASAAGDPCFTKWTQVNYYLVGFQQWWIRMTTQYCENGSIVTSHTTKVTQAHGSGWSYYAGTVHFNCYKASGSTKGCSGNYEHLTGANFFKGSAHVSCFPSISEWETYKGTYTRAWSNDCYPV